MPVRAVHAKVERRHRLARPGNARGPAAEEGDDAIGGPVLRMRAKADPVRPHEIQRPARLLQVAVAARLAHIPVGRSVGPQVDERAAAQAERAHAAINAEDDAVRDDRRVARDLDDALRPHRAHDELAGLARRAQERGIVEAGTLDAHLGAVVRVPCAHVVGGGRHFDVGRVAEVEQARPAVRARAKRHLVAAVRQGDVRRARHLHDARHVQLERAGEDARPFNDQPAGAEVADCVVCRVRDDEVVEDEALVAERRVEADGRLPVQEMRLVHELREGRHRPAVRVVRGERDNARPERRL